LLALSDVERAQTYAFCGEPPMPVHDYRATLRVVPVTDGAAHLSNGRRHSIARRSGRPSGAPSSAMRSGAGSDRCGGISTGGANKPSRVPFPNGGDFFISADAVA
jgi:hypothetical protein